MQWRVGLYRWVLENSGEDTCMGAKLNVLMHWFNLVPIRRPRKQGFIQWRRWGEASPPASPQKRKKKRGGKERKRKREDA